MPSIDYASLIVLLMGMSFFTTGARMDGRSPVVWGASSLGAWLIFTTFFVDGVLGGLLSQVLLFVGLTAFNGWRERRRSSSAILAGSSTRRPPPPASERRRDAA